MWFRGNTWQKPVKVGELKSAGDAQRPGEGKVIPIAGAACPANTSPQAAEPSVPSAVRLGLVVTASALCGGIAVVLWNRRLLTKMREAEPILQRPDPDLQGRLWEDDL